MRRGSFKGFSPFFYYHRYYFPRETSTVFELTAVWSLASTGASSLHSNAADILADTVTDLAKGKIGALVVVEGKDPTARHIMGGIELEGNFSDLLLKNYF